MVYCTDPFVTHVFNIFNLPYAGKPDDVNNKASKFYITGTGQYTKYHVECFFEHNSTKGCNISMGRYFISVNCRIGNWKGFYYSWDDATW